MTTTPNFNLFICTLVTVNACAANFTIAAIGQFGEPLTGCQVVSFASAGVAAGDTRNYKERFQGLAAKDLPEGEYVADIRCRGAQVAGQVRVSDGDRFAVLSEKRRLMRSDHRPPHLTIRMSSPRPQGESWWLTVRSLYSSESVVAHFQSETGEAAITDPEPGSYLVSVLSSAGYNCLREIDLMERTRLWTFDAAACSFQMDAFAHVVTDEDKRALKTTGWYQEMRKYEEEFWRAIERLANAARSSENGKSARP